MKPRSGFTLVELLVVIAVFGILASLGVWALRTPTHAVAANDLQSFMQQARFESVKRNRAVAVTYDDSVRTFSMRVNDVGGAAQCATNTTLVRQLDLRDGYPRLAVAVVIGSSADGFVWLPNGLVRSCAASGAVSVSAVMTVGDRFSTVTVSEAGRISVN